MTDNFDAIKDFRKFMTKTYSSKYNILTEIHNYQIVDGANV